MTTLDILKAARKRIEDPERWCQGYLRGGDKWCAIGAVYEEADEAESGFAAICDVLAAHAGLDGAAEGRLAEWNDTHTHAEVLALFDRAIATEEGKAVSS